MKWSSLGRYARATFITRYKKQVLGRSSPGKNVGATVIFRPYEMVYLREVC